MTLSQLFSTLLILAMVVGCGDPGESDATKTEDATSTSPRESKPTTESNDAAEANKTVSAAVASWEDVEKMVSDHAGKVVVIDIWSTWCIPYVRKFPNLVQLQRDYPDDVACISVNVNYDGAADTPPEAHRDAVMKFLEKRRATFQNVICSTPDLELYTQLDLAAIPAIYVYDKAGTLSKRFDNDDGAYGEDGFTYEHHIVPLVHQLIDRP